MTILPVSPIRRMFSDLARTTDLPRMSVAFATVRDVIDMELIPGEVFSDIILGKSTISDVLVAAADHLAAAMGDDIEHGRDGAEVNVELIADMRAAATTLRAAATTLRA